MNTRPKSTTHDVAAFREFMKLQREGSIDNSDEVSINLAGCWHEFDGSDDEKMSGEKIHNRMEDVHWSPPLLSFAIERHARQTGWSTRADMHTWIVNVETGTAIISERKLRYIGGMAKKLNVQPFAEEIAHMILEHGDDPRVKWDGDDRIRIDFGAFIPKTNWRTTKGRTDRLKTSISKIVGPHGWKWDDRPYKRNTLYRESAEVGQ